MPTPTLSTHAARNPTKPPQEPRRRSAATQATRNLLAEKRNVQAALLEDDLQELFDAQEVAIQRLASKYERTEDYIRRIVCNGAKYSGKRAPTLYHAILHDYSKKARNGAYPN